MIKLSNIVIKVIIIIVIICYLLYIININNNIFEGFFGSNKCLKTSHKVKSNIYIDMKPLSRDISKIQRKNKPCNAQSTLATGSNQDTSDSLEGPTSKIKKIDQLIEDKIKNRYLHEEFLKDKFTNESPCRESTCGKQTDGSIHPVYNPKARVCSADQLENVLPSLPPSLKLCDNIMTQYYPKYKSDMYKKYVEDKLIKSLKKPESGEPNQWNLGDRTSVTCNNKKGKMCFQYVPKFITCSSNDKSGRYAKCGKVYNNKPCYNWESGMCNAPKISDPKSPDRDLCPWTASLCKNLYNEKELKDYSQKYDKATNPNTSTDNIPRCSSKPIKPTPQSCYKTLMDPLYDVLPIQFQLPLTIQLINNTSDDMIIFLEMPPDDTANKYRQSKTYNRNGKIFKVSKEWKNPSLDRLDICNDYQVHAGYRDGKILHMFNLSDGTNDKHWMETDEIKNCGLNKSNSYPDWLNKYKDSKNNKMPNTQFKIYGRKTYNMEGNTSKDSDYNRYPQYSPDRKVKLYAPEKPTTSGFSGSIESVPAEGWQQLEIKKGGIAIIDMPSVDMSNYISDRYRHWYWYLKYLGEGTQNNPENCWQQSNCKKGGGGGMMAMTNPSAFKVMATSLGDVNYKYFKKGVDGFWQKITIKSLSENRGALASCFPKQYPIQFEGAPQAIADISAVDGVNFRYRSEVSTNYNADKDDNSKYKKIKGVDKGEKKTSYQFPRLKKNKLDFALSYLPVSPCKFDEKTNGSKDLSQIYEQATWSSNMGKIMVDKKVSFIKDYGCESPFKLCCKCKMPGGQHHTVIDEELRRAKEEGRGALPPRLQCDLEGMECNLGDSDKGQKSFEFTSLSKDAKNGRIHPYTDEQSIHCDSDIMNNDYCLKCQNCQYNKCSELMFDVKKIRKDCNAFHTPNTRASQSIDVKNIYTLPDCYDNSSPIYQNYKKKNSKQKCNPFYTDSSNYPPAYLDGGTMNDPTQCHKEGHQAGTELRGMAKRSIGDYKYSMKKGSASYTYCHKIHSGTDDIIVNKVNKSPSNINNNNLPKSDFTSYCFDYDDLLSSVPWAFPYTLKIMYVDIDCDINK